MRISEIYVKNISPDEINNQHHHYHTHGYTNITHTIIQQDNWKQIIWYGHKPGTCTCETTGHCPTCEDTP